MTRITRRAWIGSLVATVTLAIPGISAAQVGQSDLLNANLASEEELRTVSGLGEDALDAILEGRPFMSALALSEALGSELSEEERDALFRQLFVPINLNEATREEVLLLPGVGERMAHEFEEYRPYQALAQFRREIGKYVDDDELARLEQYVFVPIDLNSASEETILSIPGVGPRMLHEFLEYRPYRSMAQFRREIGKYVDDDELARLERYVTIR